MKTAISRLRNPSFVKSFSTSLNYARGSFPFPHAAMSSTHFQPSFLVTEADMKLPSQYASYPIRKFSLNGLGLDASRFINLVKPYYKTMEWDFYDVRREQIQLITNECTRMKLPVDAKAFSEASLTYYRGEKSLKELLAVVPNELQTKEFKGQLEKILPFRKKAASTFHITFDATGIKMERKQTKPIAQLVPDADIRSIPRTYPEITNDLLDHSLFRTFIQRACSLVKAHDPNVMEMDFVLWQTSLTPTKEQAANNSPEGIHQDGADYIISALVIERENVEGAESVVYNDDKQTILYSTILQPGEGIFQVDHNTPIWHTVTKVTVTDSMNNATSTSYGKRNSLGFDFINLVRK